MSVAEILGRERWKRKGFTLTIRREIQLFLRLVIDPYLSASGRGGAVVSPSVEQERCPGPGEQCHPEGFSRNSSRHLTSRPTQQLFSSPSDQRKLHFLCQLCFSCLSNHPPPSIPGEASLAQRQLQVREIASTTTQGIYSQRWNIKITSLIAL